ncbi:MAG: UTP--glucose-1-phosphate uridylyltransferase GalU [Proteobacteria bacterium]|nr:UTP--glucose-1-phosphate uridylyltransferase GalU [Pseudomonadota bacterium]
MQVTKSKKIRKAVLPVGGLGTRFLPATKSMPKEMLPIANKPLIQHAFEEAKEAGIEQFIFITGRNKNAITNHFDHVFELEYALNEKDRAQALAATRDWLPDAGNIIFIRQQQPMGLGHAVWCARNLIHDEPFAVLLADELFATDKPGGLLKQMVALYEQNGGNIIAVSDINIKDSNKYGIISAEGDNGTVMRITDMVEKPAPDKAPSNISIVGRYILDSGIFKHLEGRKLGSGGEVQLTDAMREHLLSGQPFYGLRLHGDRYDCGNQLGFLQANIEMAARDPELGPAVLQMIRKIAAQ